MKNYQEQMFILILNNLWTYVKY